MTQASIRSRLLHVHSEVPREVPSEVPREVTSEVRRELRTDPMVSTRSTDDTRGAAL